jgi:hypothetical protein
MEPLHRCDFVSAALKPRTAEQYQPELRVSSGRQQGVRRAGEIALIR